MARTGSIMWDMFTETGNIEVYLKYKQHARLKAKKEEEQCRKQSSSKQ